MWNNSKEKDFIGAWESKLQVLQVLTHDDFPCVFSIPVKFESYFLGLPLEVVFGVITEN